MITFIGTIDIFPFMAIGQGLGMPKFKIAFMANKVTGTNPAVSRPLRRASIFFLMLVVASLPAPH
jgi:hypothetical protein